MHTAAWFVLIQVIIVQFFYILKSLSGIKRVLFLRSLFRHEAQEIAYIVMMAVWVILMDVIDSQWPKMIGLLHPWRLTWHRMVWKITFLFQGCVLRFHVNLPGCINMAPKFVAFINSQNKQTLAPSSRPSFRTSKLIFQSFSVFFRREKFMSKQFSKCVFFRCCAMGVSEPKNPPALTQWRSTRKAPLLQVPPLQNRPGLGGPEDSCMAVQLGVRCLRSGEPWKKDVRLVGLYRGMTNYPVIWMFPKNSGFSPQIIHFNTVFQYKPSILGYHYFWKHPYRD